MATTPTPDTAPEPMRIILREVPWAAYKALRDVHDNNHIRMTYLDGILELLIPEFIHHRGAIRLSILVGAVAQASRVIYDGAGRTTLRRRRGPLSGQGREPDLSYFFGAHAEQIAVRRTLDLRVDPPPGLAIEVENSADSHWKLRVFARLRVPEVWRYDVEAGTLWFGRLGARRKYDTIEHSAALPMLSRAWALDVLERGEGLTDSRYVTLLEDWIRAELKPLHP